MLDHFAEELRLARATAGLSQSALAEALSYSGALVAKVETSERRPSLDFARRCDVVFGADEIEQQVAARHDRQGVLTRDRPPLLSVVVDEQTLRRRVGGPEVVREQLRHLVKVATALPRVRIQGRAAVGRYAGLDGPFVIATAPTGEDVVYLDGQRHGQVIDRSDYVRQMVEVWESIRGEALSQQQSLDLMTEVAETWT